MLLKFLRQAFRNQMNWQSGCVRRNNGARFSKLRDARQQMFFNLKIFRDDFDDPVRFSASRQIIVKIPSRNALRKRRRKKRRRLRFPRAFQTHHAQSCSALPTGASAATPGGTMSSKTHGSPAFAKCAAMRAPIVPAPSTTAFSIRRFIGSLFQNLAQTLQKAAGRTGYKTSIPRSNKLTQSTQPH